VTAEPPRGPIPISAPLRRALAAVRRATGAEPSAALPADAIADAERAVGAAIPHGVLAYLCALGRTPGALGRGVVLRALEGEKLEIDFGDGGVRVLLARFVEDER
jgi:hypothetical protein